MAFDNSVTITGNVTRDPELRFTAAGAPICSFGIAWNRRTQNGDDESMFFDVTCWQSLAENVAESIGRGDRVTVTGRLNYSSWEDKDTGANRSKVDITAEDVAPSLKWATVSEVSRNPRKDGGDFSSNQGQPSSNQGQTAPASNFATDEEPF